MLSNERLCAAIAQPAKEAYGLDRHSGMRKAAKSFRAGPYVFLSPRTDERLVEIKYSFGRAVKKAKITDLRFHDLRHTAATSMFSLVKHRKLQVVSMLAINAF